MRGNQMEKEHSPGILGGEYDADKVRARQEGLKRIGLLRSDDDDVRVLLDEAIAQRQRNVADALDAEQSHLCEMIDELMHRNFQKELAEEKTRSKRSPQSEKDWESFRRYCKEVQLPSLPAPPQVICAYLIKHSDGSLAVVRRLFNSITAAHRRFYNDPCDDVYTKALIRGLKAKEAAKKG
jgi:hypothetical protein